MSQGSKNLVLDRISISSQTSRSVCIVGMKRFQPTKDANGVSHLDPFDEEGQTSRRIDRMIMMKYHDPAPTAWACGLGFGVYVCVCVCISILPVFALITCLVGRSL